MHRIDGCDRDQSQLLPARVDDYVHAENPVRFIDAFAGGLDLREAGFARVDPRVTVRPGYDPADLLKLYIYGYLSGFDQADGSKPKPTAISRSFGGCAA